LLRGERLLKLLERLKDMVMTEHTVKEYVEREMEIR
jgi:hypothetical protein